MKDYLCSLAEAIKYASIYGNTSQTAHVARLLELSTQPNDALVYYLTNKRMITDWLDGLAVQGIEDYLSDSVKN